MRRKVLLAGGAILVLGAGSVLLISSLDPAPLAVGAPDPGTSPFVAPQHPLPPRPGEPGTAQAAPTPGVLVPLAAPVEQAPPLPQTDRQRMRDAVAQRRPGRAPTPASPGAAAPEPPRPEMPPAPDPATWAQVPVVAPFGAGSPAPAATRELGRYRDELSACFRADTQARYRPLGAAWSRAPGAPAGAPATGPAILLLEVDGDGQAMTVLDAPVETRGSASDATLSCAQAVLRGARLAVPTQGAARFRMRFPLKP